MEKYTVIFCEDNKICFQGKDGIADPMDILCDGKISKITNRKNIVSRDESEFAVINNVEFVFTPNA